MSQDKQPHPTRFNDGVWYVGATRVQLYGVISMWLQGYSPEEIQSSFAPLSLSDAYGAIFSYLGQTERFDDAFRKQDALFNRLRAESEAQHQTLYADMRERVAHFRASRLTGRSS